MNDTKTTVFLIPAEVQQFISFQKNYELFQIIEKSGILQMQFGKGILHIANGQIQKVTLEQDTYKRM